MNIFKAMQAIEARNNARNNMLETAAFLVRRIKRLEKAIEYYHRKYGDNGSKYLYNLYYRKGLYESWATLNVAMLTNGHDKEFNDRILKGRI